MRVTPRMGVLYVVFPSFDLRPPLSQTASFFGRYGAESSVANPHHSKRNGCALLAVSSLRMSRSLNGQVPFASVSEFTGALRGWALPT